MRSELVVDALSQDPQSRLSKGTIFHGDRVSPYGSATFRTLLNMAGMGTRHVSASQPPRQRLDGILHRNSKARNLQDGCFETASDTRTEIFESIEGYYNTHRKHSAIGYQTPSQFEAQIHSAK